MSCGKGLREIPGETPSPEELGNSGWNVLHSAAAVYPYKPSAAQQEGFRSFLYGWSQVYACGHCAYHMRRYLERNPPVVTDKLAVNRYICEFHNAVNKNVGKPFYDCDPMNVLRRWHPTFPEMEDEPTIEEQLAEQQRLKKVEMKEQTNETIKQQRQTFVPSDDYNQSRSVRRWFRAGADGDDSDSNNVAVGAFVSGWSSSTRQEINKEGKEKVELRETGISPAAKRRSFFGNSDVTSATSISSGIKSNDMPVTGDGRSVITTDIDKVPDDDVNIQSVLKRLKACMIYCPEDNKKSASG